MRETNAERAENFTSLPNCPVMHSYAQRLLATVSPFNSQPFRFSPAATEPFAPCSQVSAFCFPNFCFSPPITSPKP
jgi:hypothetical protein